MLLVNVWLFFISDKAIVFDDSDEEVMSLFSSTASKVVVKNFKQMDEDDLSKLNFNRCYHLFNY